MIATLIGQLTETRQPAEEWGNDMSKMAAKMIIAEVVDFFRGSAAPRSIDAFAQTGRLRTSRVGVMCPAQTRTPR